MEKTCDSCDTDRSCGPGLSCDCICSAMNEGQPSMWTPITVEILDEDN